MYSTIRFLSHNFSVLKSNFHFVPKHTHPTENEIKLLEEFLISKPNILVLTGAGISTESGIPDYRSEGVGLYARTNHKPIQYLEFLKSAKVRQRYWARNFVGWPRFSATEPNDTHYALAKFEREGRILGIVTQNVDRLHTKARSKNVVEIHGNSYTVMCLSCNYRTTREEFQYILKTLNPQFVSAPSMIRPDGDVEIPQKYMDNFMVPSCPKCGGDLKPDIIFFGDNVPKDRWACIFEMLYKSDGLLVLGSSLLVYSGYRLVLEAKDIELPVAIVNIGKTRGDHVANIKLSAKCGDIIPKLFRFK